MIVLQTSILDSVSDKTTTDFLTRVSISKHPYLVIHIADEIYDGTHTLCTIYQTQMHIDFDGCLKFI